jgi:hypothetical protein
MYKESQKKESIGTDARREQKSEYVWCQRRKVFLYIISQYFSVLTYFITEHAIEHTRQNGKRTYCLMGFNPSVFYYSGKNGRKKRWSRRMHRTKKLYGHNLKNKRCQKIEIHPF